MKSILIKDTTKEEREEIIKASLDCGGGCENCSSCWLGGGQPLGYSPGLYRWQTGDKRDQHGLYGAVPTEQADKLREKWTHQ